MTLTPPDISTRMLRLFSRHPTWRAAVRSHWDPTPPWVGILAARAAMLVGEDEVEHFEGHYEPNRTRFDTQGAGWFAIYTRTLLIGTTITLDGPEPTVSAIPRSSLSGLEVYDGGENLFADYITRGVDWRGHLKVRLTYPTGPIELPGDSHMQEDDAWESFYEFLPSLLDDLRARP